MQTVRSIDSNATNAVSTTRATGGTLIGAPGYNTPVIKNNASFYANVIESDGHTFAARYPGDLGNSLRVSICADSAAFDAWAYKSGFDAKPGHSTYDRDRNGFSTEIHLAVVDRRGLISGTKGTILEAYPYVSVASNSKNADGTTNYVKDVVNEKVNEGLSKKEIYSFLSDKYGDWILFNTPLKKNSYFLWFMPYISVSYTHLTLPTKA